MRKKIAVYWGGVIVFGLVYQPIKEAAPSGVGFLLGAIGYLLLLRVVGNRVERI